MLGCRFTRAENDRHEKNLSPKIMWNFELGPSLTHWFQMSIFWIFLPFSPKKKVFDMFLSTNFLDEIIKMTVEHFAINWC